MFMCWPFVGREDPARGPMHTQLRRCLSVFFSYGDAMFLTPAGPAAWRVHEPDAFSSCLRGGRRGTAGGRPGVRNAVTVDTPTFMPVGTYGNGQGDDAGGPSTASARRSSSATPFTSTFVPDWR